MGWSGLGWWRGFKVQHKVWAVLFLLCVPLVVGLGTHLYFVQQLLNAQTHRHDLLLAREQVHVLRRLAIDIEDAFRGYVLTQQPEFLTPLIEAESKLDQALAMGAERLAVRTRKRVDLAPVEQRLKKLLESKHDLITTIQQGNVEQALAYVRSGQGLRLSDALRKDLRLLEDQLEEEIQAISANAEALSKRTFIGLWLALGGLLGLGWIGSRLLARSVTEPVGQLHAATATLGESVDSEQVRWALTPTIQLGDEFGRLAGAYLDMVRLIETHVRELEVLHTIGQEINTIGPDGLDGVLRRITDRAADLVQADVCLVLLRDERMGCWIVEAGSGEWDDRLKNSVMLWEELPVCVEAYESRRSSVGQHFRKDRRPQVARRNLIGDSMLAIPLLAQGAPFGVLSFLSERPRGPDEWNQRLAKGMAQEAAMAISNVRLYEEARQNKRGLLARLRQLEHLAETLAHDLKGPGARMEELARLLSQKFSGQIDERTARWLTLIQENGNDIVRRVEGILSVARVGTGQGSVMAVDPALVIGEVLKAQAGEIERLRATIQIDSGMPVIACHGAYLRQVFDNLISNALKFARPGEAPAIRIHAAVESNMVCFSVEDHGIGISSAQRERVFQPFVRLMQSDAAGSGIGLTIVQRIIELYGGRVWIEGDESKGCTVKFTMPWLREEGIAAFLERKDSGASDIMDMPTTGLV